MIIHRKVTGEGSFENNWNWKKKPRIRGGCALGEMKSVILLKTFLLVNLFILCEFIQTLGIEGCLYSL